MYELALEPGALPRYTKTSRGIGSLDPVRTRVLLWHLSQLGMTVAEGRALIAQHGMDVEQVLRRVHYERTVKGGVDAHGREITHWALWTTKALKKQWTFDEPEYLSWLDRQSARFALAPAREAARIAPAGEPAAAMGDPESLPSLELPSDDVWGWTLRELSEEIGEIQLRTWFAATWIDEVVENAVTVGTSNAFAADWIRSRWGERLEEVLSRRLERPVRLHVVSHSGAVPLP